VRGGPGRGHKTTPESGVVLCPPSFVQDTASKTGRPAPRIYEEVQIAERIADEAKDRIWGTLLEDKKTE